MKTTISKSKCYRINGLSYIPIEGFPQYAINHTGKIAHIIHGEVEQHENVSGHLVVNLHRDGGVHPRLVHRLILEHFEPSWEPETWREHLDGDKTNNHICNLSHVKIPLNDDLWESSTTRRGFKLSPSGETCRTVLEASELTGISATDIAKQAASYRSFVLGNVRFTSLFA